jgi:hypothetical protein
VTGYRLDGRSSSPGRSKIFLPCSASILALGPAQPIRWVPGVKRPGSEADHSPPTSAEVKSGGAIPPLPHRSSWRGAEVVKHRDNVTRHPIAPRYTAKSYAVK